MAETAASERDHLRFALALHGALAADGANSCFSPYSVASALALVARGARGETADELAALLAAPGAGPAAHRELLQEASVLASAGAGQEQGVLAVSNTLWAWDGLPLEEAFREELAAWPSGGVAKAPFVDDPDGARERINADVAEVTGGLIPELLAQDDVTADTVACLVNALYLRVAWTFPFRDGATEDGDFRAPDGVVRVPMMRQNERLGYAEGGGWRLAALPAVGGVQAAVLLPDGDLTEAEASLDSGALGALLDATEERMVDVSLPRLALDVRADLTSALGGQGVRTLFTPGADLSGISEDDRLYVDAVLHQAVLRVDESGIEGAAATAATMRLVSMPAGDPVTFVVDRPFLLLVRHAGTGAVYFLARVARP